MAKTFNLMSCAYHLKTDCKLRPMMSGIYHDNGYQVASDSHILVAINEPYPAVFEGKTYTREQKLVEGRFPKWRDIIPNDLSEAIEVEIDFKKWDEIKKTCKRELKEGKIWKGISVKPQVFVQVGEVMFKMEWFDKLAKFMRSAGVNKIATRGRYAAVVKKDDNYGLLMPVMPPKTPNDELDGVYMNRVYELA